MKNYNIINSIDKSVLLTFQATEKEAVAIHTLTYDTSNTSLIEHKPLTANCVGVSNEGEHDLGIIWSFQIGDIITHVAINDSGDCFVLEPEDYSVIEKIDFQQLTEIPAFLELCRCPYCKNRGVKDVGEIPHSQMQECDCEDSVFYLQEIYNSI